MSLLDPTYPNKNNLAFLDGVVEHLRILLGTNLTWLDYNYGEQFTFDQDVNGSRVLVPNVYVGSNRYLQTTIDNKKTGTCFFIVGSSSATEYRTNLVNFYETPISIIFEANLNLIDDTQDEYFREQLISEVLTVLRNPRGSYYETSDITVTRDLNDVFTEFGYNVRQEYKFPLTAFRVDLTIVHQADCNALPQITECDNILNLLSPEILINCVIPNIDFCNEDYKNALTQEQIDCINS